MDGRAWRRLHGWVALVLAILIMPATLSGAMLMWPEAIGRLTGAPRFATSGAALLPVDRYARAARPVLRPGERIAEMILPDRRGAPVVVTATSVAATGAVQVDIFLDPPTARVLEVAASDAGAVGFLRRVHGKLLVPGAGRSIVGAGGVIAVMLVMVGVVVWWPGRRRRAGRGSVWLGYAVGVLIAVPLLVWSFSGVWIGVAKPAPVSARPMARPAQPLSVVVARAVAIAPGAVRRIVWPTERNPDWTVGVASAAVKVADDSGSAVAAPARVPAGLAGRSMLALHDGSGLGVGWRVAGLIAGLAPVVMLVVGIVAWRRRGVLP
ncbi:PepSY domain-containing protein [Sphingomonas sp. BT553]|uniref:PepSY domain-containing protein n=2 Tax=Sphingomonas mollis TaxID=2795726 RepID=A0ABS0XSB8_9SPHN|nr:PepSY-associated TM helix domain-containing protein [Sphingomonas sp. BT553]MBJ6122926.1 PepSY domain-containing protein [Sphingomonas sp. BT553]